MKTTLIILIAILSLGTNGQIRSNIAATSGTGLFCSTDSAFIHDDLLGLNNMDSMANIRDTTIYDPPEAYTIINTICDIRGHVSSGLVSITDLYCQPYVIDNDSCTVLVHPSCNWISYQCARCGNRVIEKEKERREVIWKK